MPKKFSFEIQALIVVEEEGADAEEARLRVMDKLHSGYYDDDLNRDPYVSNGTEVK